MIEKGNIKYEIKPKNIDIGEQWISVELENISDRVLQNLSVRIHSLDTFGLEVIEGNRYIQNLASETLTTVNFRIRALFTAHLYISIEGYEDEEFFYWETMPERINVGQDIGEIVYFVADTKSRIILDDKIKSEIGVKANDKVSNLRIEFWAEDPEHIVEEINTATTGEMSANEMKVFTTSFTPDKKGVYTIYTYLYDGIKRLGAEKMFLLVE